MLTLVFPKKYENKKLFISARLEFGKYLKSTYNSLLNYLNHDIKVYVFTKIYIQMELVKITYCNTIFGLIKNFKKLYYKSMKNRKHNKTNMKRQEVNKI